MYLPLEYLLLAAALLLGAGVLATKLSSNLGVPYLVLFLLVGILAGSEGPGGIPFEDYRLARAIRRQTHAVGAALERLQVARAFTCYQMAALLAHAPAGTNPTLVFDLTATFYDESARPAESLRHTVYE